MKIIRALYRIRITCPACQDSFVTRANDVELKDGTVRRKGAIPIDIAIFRRHAKSIHGAKITPRQTLEDFATKEPI